MKRVAIISKALAKVGYDEASQTLEITFKDGRVYEFEDVPAKVHFELMTSASKGSYFQDYIRDIYHFRRTDR
jgi:hypothetical protein